MMLYTYRFMLLTAAPVLLVAEPSQVFLEQAQHPGTQRNRNLRTSTTALTVARSCGSPRRSVDAACGVAVGPASTRVLCHHGLRLGNVPPGREAGP